MTMIFSMTKTEFHKLFTDSSKLAFDFAKIYVLDNLPNDFKYNVRLNFSHDDPNLKQFDIYPNDNDKTVELLQPQKLLIYYVVKTKFLFGLTYPWSQLKKIIQYFNYYVRDAILTTLMSFIIKKVGLDLSELRVLFSLQVIKTTEQNLA